MDRNGDQTSLDSSNRNHSHGPTTSKGWVIYWFVWNILINSCHFFSPRIAMLCLQLPARAQLLECDLAGAASSQRLRGSVLRVHDPRHDHGGLYVHRPELPTERNLRQYDQCWWPYRGSLRNMWYGLLQYRLGSSSSSDSAKMGRRFNYKANCGHSDIYYCLTHGRRHSRQAIVNYWRSSKRISIISSRPRRFGSSLRWPVTKFIFGCAWICELARRASMTMMMTMIITLLW